MLLFVIVCCLLHVGCYVDACCSLIVVRCSSYVVFGGVLSVVACCLLRCVVRRWR